MKRSFRSTARVLLILGSLATIVVAQTQVPAFAAVAAPPTPAEEELTAGSDSSITIEWPASPGATSYNIYRGTTSGGEGTTPIVSTTATTYKDANLSPTPIYFYQITAVNSGGESARTAEDASKTPPPIGTGGNVAGVASGASEISYAKDSLLGGFDWFQTLTGWFPQVLGSSGASSPGGRVVDMAYSTEGTMTFNNVVVPTAGLYTIDWRYAFQSGLFPGVNNRQMGLKVNGTVITSTQRFPITGSFETYQDTALQVHLNAGVNSVQMFAVTDHGVSRVDELIVSPATASSPSAPTHLTATPANTSVTLSWTASATGSPTSYSIYRGSKSDGEVVVAVGTTNGTTTTFTDTGLHNGTTYFYNVAANNAVGVSPDSNEVTGVPGGVVTTPAAPTGLTATAGNASVALTWGASAGATSYSIFRGTAAGGESATAIGTSTSPSFADNTAVNGTKYYYRVTATNSAGTSGNSNEASATPAVGTVTVPAAPTGLTASAGNATVSLTWGASAGATSYSIFRGTAAGGESATAIGTSTSPSFADNTAVNGTKYYYRVTATNSAGTSGNSNEASATPAAGGTAPGVPFGVVITPRAGNILLQWGNETGVTSYHVFRGTTPGGEGATPLATTTSPTYTDTAVVSGTTYYYQFTALIGTAESARTVEKSAIAQ